MQSTVSSPLSWLRNQRQGGLPGQRFVRLQEVPESCGSAQTSVQTAAASSAESGRLAKELTLSATDVLQVVK
jgi:hypothetical protein